MADIYKTAVQAGREARSRGQTGISVGDGSLRAMAESARSGMSTVPNYAPGSASRRSAITPPGSASTPIQEDPLEAISRRSTAAGYEDLIPQEAPTQQKGDGSLLGDVGRSVMGGLVNLGGSAYELSNLASFGGLDTVTKGAFGTSGTEALGSARDYWRSGESSELKAQRQELEKADGFLDSFKTIITNPRLAGAMTLEMVPQLLTVAGAARFAAAKTLAGAAKAGLTAEAAQAAAATNATRTVLGLNAAMEGGAAGQDARQSVMTMSEAELDQSPQYQALVKQYGDTPDGRTEARLRLANDASMFAAAIAAPISLISGKITGAGELEAKALTKGVAGAAAEGAEQTGKRTALGVAKDIGVAGLKEVPQEAIEEGGSQFGTNVGVMASGAKPNQDLLEGVGQAAGAGGALGLVAGVGFGAMGEARTRVAGKTDTTTGEKPAGTAPQGSPVMSDAEYGAAVNSSPYMAAAYARADEATRARLRAANPDINFDELVKDEKSLKIGGSLIDNNPSFFEAFNARLPEVSEQKAPEPDTEPPFTTNDISNPPADVMPMRERMRMAQDLAQQGMDEAEGKYSRAKTEVSPAPESLNAGPEIQMPGLPSQDVLIRGYERRAENLMSMPEGARGAAATSSMQEMISRGFTPEQAQSVFGRVLNPQAEPAQVEEIEAAAPPQDTSLDFTKEDIRPKLDPNFMTFAQVRERMAQKDLGREPTAKVTDYIETPVPPQIRDLAKRFGVQVYGFRYAGNNKLLRTRQGASLSGGVVLLNADAQNSHLSIFGHELYHELRRRNPEAAAQLEQEILSYVTQPGKEKLADKLLKVGYDISKIDEEMTADLMGLMFSEREFWAELGQKQPTLLEKIIQVIDDMLAKFGDLSSRKTAIAKYVTDMQAVREMLVGFVNESQGGTEQPTTSAPTVEFKGQDMGERGYGIDLSLNYGDYKVYNDGGTIIYEMTPPKELNPGYKIRSLSLKPDGVALRVQKDSGNAFKVDIFNSGVDLESSDGGRFVRWQVGEDDAVARRVLGSVVDILNKASEESQNFADTTDQIASSLFEKLGLQEPSLFNDAMSYLRSDLDTSGDEARITSDLQRFVDSGAQKTDLDFTSDGAIDNAFEDASDEDKAALQKVRGLLSEGKTPEAAKLFSSNKLMNKTGVKFTDLQKEKAAPVSVETPPAPEAAQEEETPVRYDQSAIDLANAEKNVRKVVDLLRMANNKAAPQGVRNKALIDANKLFKASNLTAFGEDFKELEAAVQAEGSKKISQAIFGQEPQGSLPLKRDITQFDAQVAEIMSGETKRVKEKKGQRKATALDKAIESKQAALNRRITEDYNPEDLPDTTLDNDTGGVMTQLAMAGSLGGAEGQIQAEQKTQTAEERKAEEDRLVAENAAIMSARVRALLNDVDRKLGQLAGVRDLMARDGFSESQINATVSKAESELRGLRDGELQQLVEEQLRDTSLVAERTKLNEAEPAEATKNEEQTELDLNDKQRTDARRLVDAISKKEMTFEEALNQIRKNEIGLMHLYDAMREAGVEVSKERIDISGNVAVNYTLNDYVKKFPTAGLAARDSWLRAYDALPVKGIVNLTPGEEAAYKSWKREMGDLRNRLKEKQGFDSIENAFPNALFLNYTLNEMRDPNKIEEPRRSMIKNLFEDPVRSWFEDVKFVTTARPDLKPQLENYLTPSEMTAYQEFAERETREARRVLDMKMRSPAYSQLDSLRYLSPDLYTNFRQEIAQAEQNQLAVILQKAFEQNELAKAAKEAGKDIGETIDQYLTQVVSEDEMYSESPDQMSDENGETRYRRGVYSGVVPALTIQEHFEGIFSKWDTPPAYTVVQNPNQLPDDVRARLTSRFANNDFRGAIDPKTGHVYVFSDFVTSVEDAEFTMFHELFGHWGMRAFLGDSINSFLNTQYRLNKDVREEADRQMEQAKKDGMPMTKLESIEEAIADQATKGNDGPFRELIGRLVRWLRKHGMNNVADWMDGNGNAELAFVLAQARKVAMSKQGISPLAGAPSQAMYSRRKMPVEMFAIRDGQTTAYARINPITQQWTVFTLKDPSAPLSQANFSAQSVDEAWQAHDLLKKFGSVTLSRDRDTRQEVDPNNASQIPDFKDLTGWSKFKRNMIIQFQNMFLPIFEVARFLESKGVKNSVIDDLIKYESRLQYYVDDYTRKYATPIQQLLKAIGEKGATIEDVDLFLMARHAEERNNVIKAINPKNTKGSGLSTKDAQKILKSKNDGKWSDYMTEMEKLGDLMDQMSRDKLAYMLNTGLINKFQYESLMRYKHYVNLSGNKELGLDEYDGSELGGRSFNVAGNDVIRATGRGTLAVDVLQNTMNSYLSTLIRGQKNRPLQAILKMFEQNPDATYVQVEKISTKKKINIERFNFDKKILKAIGTDKASEAAGKNYLTGLLKRMERGEIDADGAMAELAERIRLAEDRRDITPEEAARAIRNISEQVVLSARLAPDGYVTTVEDTNAKKNQVVVKINGAPVTMSFTGRGIEFFQAITGMNVQQSSGFVEAIGAWNRLFSQMVTTWNPAWVPVNALRDIQTAFANAAADPEVGAELAGKMLKDWKRMHKIAFRHLVADQANAKQGFWGSFLKGKAQKNPLTAEEKALIDEFFKEGGGTFFLDRAGLEQTLDKLNRHLNPAKLTGGVKEAAQWTEDKLSGVADLMELMTMPVEMAPRLAAYKVMRDAYIERGMSPEEARSKAARYAKELTVNFNMKGANKQFRALYVFANPAIQGTVRMFQDLKEGNYKRFGAVAGTWMMLGLVGNMLARALGDDDDKPGIDKLDMVPNYRRATQFIWAPDTYGGAIPVAYGWNVFMAAGHYLYDSMFGYLKPEEAATRVMTAAFDAFAPIGSGAESQTFAGMVLKTGLPTPMVPIVEMAMNENRFGAPIYKEQSSNSNIKEADAYMHFNSVNPISKWAMQSLAQATSGDRNPRYNSALIDVNPGSVDHFISSYLPGLFSEAYKAAGVAITASQGRDTKEQDIPVISRLRAKVDEESFDSGAFRRVSETVDTRYREYMDGETSNTRRAEILKQYPNIGGIKALFSGTEQQIKSLRQNLTAIDRNPNISDEERVSQRNRIEKMEQEYRRRAIKEALKRGFRDEVIDNSPD